MAYTGRMSRYRSIAMALALVAFVAFSTEGEAQCVSRAEGQQLVRSGQVAKYPDALRRAGIKSNEVVGDPQLCRAGGWVYRVPILRGGRRTTVNIPAG